MNMELEYFNSASLDNITLDVKYISTDTWL